MDDLEQTTVFVQDFKQLLTELLDKVRTISKIHHTPVAQARINAQWELLDTIMLFLTRRETDMQRLKSDLVKQVISLDDLEPIRKHSDLEDRIHEAIAILPPNGALPGSLIKEGIEWGHFSAKVAQMRLDGKISQDITTSKRGDKFYLVRLPKGQVVKARNAR